MGVLPENSQNRLEYLLFCPFFRELFRSQKAALRHPINDLTSDGYDFLQTFYALKLL